MNLIDLSNSKNIGSTCFYLEVGTFKIIVDAGLDPKQVGLSAVPNFSIIKNHTIDYILLTHCHLDHLGSLPIILSKNPNAKIITSYASSILAISILKNSYNVMRKIKKELKIAEYPLYSLSQIKKVKNAFLIATTFNKVKLLKENDKIFIEIHKAGHIAGAVGFKIMHKNKKIFFTGDILFENQITLSGAKFPNEHCDILVTECTRGSILENLQSNRNNEIDNLIKIIQKTLMNGGSCLIPVFALGRMQEIFAILEIAIKKNQLKHYPIFSSGLGIRISKDLDILSKSHNEIHFSKDIIDNLNIQPLDQNIFPGKYLQQGIYVISSGMIIPKTPSYNIAATILENSKNSICFIGYCDPETIGGKLLKTKKNQNVLFKEINYTCKLKANIYSFNLTGHAKREEIVEYAQKISPFKIILTHGEESSRKWFHDALRSKLPTTEIINPDPGLIYNL